MLEVHDGVNIEKEAGLLFLPEAHTGCTQSSDQEVERIAKTVDELLKCRFISEKGKSSLELSDILIVAPYNHQVSKLKRRLGDAARVGTVDKFQGQQAAVVIVSMCCSNGDDAPRGINFVFDEHRLNEALSRAQALAIVVASPDLVSSYCSTVDKMKLVNRFCKVVQIGSVPAEAKRVAMAAKLRK